MLSNDTLFLLLKHLTFERRPVVILADRPKEEMDKDCQDGLQDYDLEIHTRSGIPCSITDLNRVSAGTAKTILLLNPPDTQARSNHMIHTYVAALIGICLRHFTPEACSLLRMDASS